MHAPVIRSFKIFKYELVWLLVDDFRAGCDYVFECVFGNYVRNERCVPKKWITLTWLCMCVPWVSHGLKPEFLHVKMLYFTCMNMLKTWCSYEFKVAELNDNSWEKVTLKMHLRISLKTTRNVLMFNVQEGEKMDCKKVIKFPSFRKFGFGHLTVKNLVLIFF